jgi:hypothetical protein
MAQVTFLYNKSNAYGLLQDADVLALAFRKAAEGYPALNFTKIRHQDPLEPPTLCDFLVHFEVPIYGAMPWARMNAFMINPEWWEDAWDPYLSRANAVLFKCKADESRFKMLKGDLMKGLASYVLPWTTSLQPSQYHSLPRSKDFSCLWLLAGSVNKQAAACKILPLWKEPWPTVHVYTTKDLGHLGELPMNVHIHVQDLPPQTRRELQAYYPCHLVFSQSEALGMTSVEAASAGAFVVGNRLPVYEEIFGSSSAAYLVPSTLEPLKAGMRDTFENLTAEALEAAWAAAKLGIAEARGTQEAFATARFEEFVSATRQVLQDLFAKLPAQKKVLKVLPPVLTTNELPPISVITLLHNRRKFVDLAFHNLLITDYPKDRIEWVVVEDSDNTEEQAADKILKFGREAAPMNVTYIPLDKINVPIGAMRNRGIKRAQHDIILFMDDDDHYPPTSFRRRVSWLLKHPWNPQAVACTTIACYDLLKGTSAVNTPPWSLGLKGRLSEATLAFRKSWWEEKKFPKVSMAEGEGFVEGREQDILELQPQQAIVAMSHSKNASSRRIPPGPSGKPSCFWGFPKEYLIFLHGLAGVELDLEN